MKKSTIFNRKALINEILISFVAAIILKHIGDYEFAWQDIFEWEYIVRLLTIVIDVLVLWETVKYFSRIFDSRFPWEEVPQKRAVLQFGLVTLFSLIAVSLSEEFFRYLLIEEHIDQQYFTMYVPILALMSLFLSLHYKVVSIKNKKSENEVESNFINTVPLVKGASINKVAVNDIAYFYYTNRIVFAVTNDGKEGIVDFSLNNLSERLDSDFFLKVNRQFILSKNSIVKYQEIENRKLEIFVLPPTNSCNRIIISNKKTTRIKNWMNSS